VNSLAKQLLETADQAARHVGVRIKSTLYQSEGVDIQFKGTNDLVTEVDIWSEKEIAKIILSKYPDHRIIGEEDTAANSKSLLELSKEAAKDGVVWCVDPIDGTKNFANKVPHVCVSIGAQVNNERVMGLVYDPFREEMFTAIKGEGAFLNGKKISASKKTKVADAMAAIGFPSDMNWSRHLALFDSLVTNARGLRVTGSAALDQCWVACGRFDAFLEYNLKPWDIHGGSLIVEEAGGKLSNFAEPADKQFSVFDNSYLCACPGIFAELLGLARSAKS
jgi:myo-inositol-1(or 4)-monophosphatase